MFTPVFLTRRLSTVLKFAMCSSVIILLMVLSVVKSLDKAYVVNPLRSYFECKVLATNGFCPDDIAVDSVGNGTVAQSIATMINKTAMNTTLLNLNQTCIDTIQKITCLSIPRCEPERLYVDVDVLLAECERGRNICPQLRASPMFNCTQKKEEYERFPINAHTQKCTNIQDSTGFCPQVKYKRVEIPGANITRVFNALKMNIEMIKRNVTEECYEQVKETACIFSTTACSDNEKYGLALLSMQECKKRLKCLPQPLYANISKGCNELPDETTAKEVPLPSGAAGKPTVKPTSSYIQLMATPSVNQTGGNPTGSNKTTTGPGPTDGSSVIRAVYNMVAFSLISLLFL